MHLIPVVMTALSLSALGYHYDDWQFWAASLPVVAIVLYIKHR